MAGSPTRSTQRRCWHCGPEPRTGPQVLRSGADGPALDQCLRAYPEDMNTIHLSDEELDIARHGMTAYLRSFGHDEADTVHMIQAVLARLAAAQAEPDEPAPIG